jgi:hypothetical protein
MAKKIKMWRVLGPRLAPATAMEDEEVVEDLVEATNESRGSLLSVLAELDVITERALKAGRIVRLPNGTHYRPRCDKDGNIKISVKLPTRVLKNINTGFRGEIINAANVGKSEAEMIALWNETYPDDLIEE